MNKLITFYCIWRPQVFNSKCFYLNVTKKKIGLEINSTEFVLMVAVVVTHPFLLMHSEMILTRTSGSHNSFHLGGIIQSYNIHQLECWGKGMIHVEGYEAIARLTRMFIGHYVQKCILLTHSLALTHSCCGRDSLQIQIVETSAQGCVKNHKIQIPFNQVQCFGFSVHILNKPLALHIVNMALWMS